MAASPLIDLYIHRGLSFSSGDGVYLMTAEGDRYLDLMTNYGVDILGHGHPVVTRALVDQVGRLPSLHGSFGHRGRIAAARALAQRVPPGDGHVAWCNSGAEAVEAALKFAVLATGKRHFVACEGGYHGKTLGALSATHGGRYREPFEPLLWRFDHVPFGDAAALEAALDESTAGLVIEPIQGEGGVVVPPPGYLRAARDLCAQRGVLLILDEVQTGCGRTGAFTAAAGEGVAGDITCLGKGLAGGVPAGATVVSPAISAAIPRSAHSSTLGGNPLACAGAAAVLSCVDDDMLARVTRLGAMFRERLGRIRHDRIAQVRGRGLMVGVQMRGARDEVLKGLQRERVLALPAGADVVRFLPPYVVEPEHLERAAAALETVLEAL
ncbi:MAG: aspartate aminotransferase family protein [Candidatus Polarisedimenticolia bacterium]